jgi:hypothetical protein
MNHESRREEGESDEGNGGSLKANYAFYNISWLKRFGVSSWETRD